MSLRNEKLTPSQMIVDRKRYAQLQGMEWRHLGYLRAAEYMGLLQLRHTDSLRDAQARLNTLGSQAAAYELGFLDAIKQMGAVQLRMIEQTLDAHPDHDTTPGPFRKGQLCLIDQAKCMCLVIARESE